jgi:transposase
MDVHNQQLVDIPDSKGVHVKSAGVKGDKYVYLYVKYFRNADGNPRNRAKSIGKVASEIGKMVPNSNYFELFHVHAAMPDVSVWEYGYSFLIGKVCRDIGLLDCLKQIFGDKAMDIIVMAAYIIREGNAMDGIDDWQQRNFFSGYHRLLNSQTTSKIFAWLKNVGRISFFKKWVKQALSDASVCYDVTSISSYSQEMTSVERGYNRDGDDLSQFNLGMFCDESTKTPLYFNRYNGSLTDKTNLACVLANAKAVGIERVKMVLDGGFWSEECLTNLAVACEAFTVGMPTYLKESEVILSAHSADIEKYENELPCHHIYCVSESKKIYGVTGNILLYFDAQNHVSQCKELSEQIDRLKAELAELKRYPKCKLKRYEQYFTITKHENDSGFDWAVDTEKVQKSRQFKGFFLLFSTDQIATPGELLDYYRAKDADEKLFSQIKVDMGGSRIRTHNEETTDGKTFVTFIACVIRAYILRKLSKYLIDNSTSVKKALNQMSNIVIIASNGEFRFAHALTKKQKQILSAFNAENDIISSLGEICLR